MNVIEEGLEKNLPGGRGDITKEIFLCMTHMQFKFHMLKNVGEIQTIRTSSKLNARTVVNGLLQLFIKFMIE